MNLDPVPTLAVSSFTKDFLKKSHSKVEIQGLPSKIRAPDRRATFPQSFDVEEFVLLALHI